MSDSASETFSSLLKTLPLVVGMAAVLCAAPASATTVTAHLTADDAFSLYLSTDDAVTGTFIGSGNAWEHAQTLTAELTPGVVNYLHVDTWDVYGGWAAFLGDFSLSDSSFHFANETQSLLTQSSGWSMSYTGFGQDYYTPNVVGSNGSGPWGFIQGISANASWIWSFTGYAGSDTLGERYFSATIEPGPGTPAAPVPEPVSLVSGAMGLVCVGAYIRRRRRTR